MKKFTLLSVFAVFIVISSCKKNKINTTCTYTESSTVAPASEQQALLDSLNAYGIQATKDSSGFYYTINQPGTAPGITNLCTSIAAFYRGGFFNGTGFDSTATGNPAIFQLGQVIVGWQKGIPHVNKNGNITLYLPPSLAYDSIAVKNPNTGQVVIPANSYLVFRISIADIQ
jgi:FKBP-type peptidyl-prolyl cis-trans isomerase FkpA